MPHIPGTGAIFGIVSENGVAKDNSPVYLMDMRRDVGSGQMKVIAKQMTRQDGGFTFSSLNTQYNDYSIMVSDEDGAEPKNALIQDRIQPVPVHVGSGIFGDWYTRIMKSGAEVAIIPFPLSEKPLLPMGIGSRVLYGSTPLDATKLYGTPEVPGMSAIELNTASRMVTIGNRKALTGAFSLEFIFDFDSFDAVSTSLLISLGIHGGLTTGSTARTSRSGMSSYLAISKNKVLDYYADGSNLTASFDLSDLQGFKHIVVTFLSSTNVSLYVEGVLRSSIATNISIISAANFNLGIEVGGTNSNGLGAKCVIGPIVGYRRILSQQEVNANYNALFNNNQVPLVTGYAAELCKELPYFYYRFNESEHINGLFSELNYFDPSINTPEDFNKFVISDVSQIEYPINSPFIGQSAFRKPSNVTIKGSMNGIIGTPFSDQMTFCGWVNFSSDNPLSNESIIRFTAPPLFSSYYGYASRPDGLNNGWFKFYRNSSRKLSVDIFIGSSLSTHTFNYTPPANKWINFWYVIDMSTSSPSAKLYIGTEDEAPVLVGTLSIQKASIFNPTSYDSRTVVPFAGHFTVDVGESLGAGIRDIALLPLATKVERMTEIWLAKDIA